MANKYLDDNGLLYFWQQLKTLFAGKVDVVSGKGLSTNDFTNADKTKLDGIEAGAEANVNADWDAVTGDAAILNKPTIPTKTSDLTNDGDGTSNFATEAYADAHGGAIDVIKVNGTTQTITNKTVDMQVAELGLTLNDGKGSAAVAGFRQANGSNTNAVVTVTAPANNETVTVRFEDGASQEQPYTSTLPTKNYVDSTFQDATEVATAISTALANSGDAYQTESDVEAAIDAALTSLYKYKGSVATYSQLPSSGQEVGDVWNVEADGMNYAWTGSEWDALGGSFTITAITNAEIDAIMAQ